MKTLDLGAESQLASAATRQGANRFLADNADPDLP
jgi:predicted nicotinamide N-methyase